MNTIWHLRRRRAVRRYLSDRTSVVATVAMLLLVVVAIVGPHLVSIDPSAQDLQNRLAGPSSAHWFGTDSLGRDVLARLVSALGVTMIAAVQAFAVSAVLGIPLGLLAGLVRGPIDAVLSRVADGLLALPPLMLAFAIVGILGKGLGNAMIAIGIVLAPRFFRIARGAAAVAGRELFAEAARADGCNTLQMLYRHILPNSVGPLVVQASITIAIAVLSEASLSFLGLGVQAPQASLGSMIQDAGRHLDDGSYLLIPPSVTLVLAVLLLFTIGDGLRDAVGRAKAGS